MAIMIGWLATNFSDGVPFAMALWLALDPKWQAAKWA
jgi:hypothetical protein